MRFAESTRLTLLKQQVLDEFLRARVQEALDDPRPSIPAQDVFAELRRLHADQARAERRGS
jgi:antitoxin ParD1/3/4